MSYTDHYGLSRLGAGDDFSDDGYKYTDRDRVALDRLIYQAGEGHQHNGLAASAGTASDTLGLTIIDTAGSIPAGTRVYYKYSLVDVQGNESLPSPEQFIDTAAPIVEPTAPTLTAGSTGGTLLPGNYYYTLSAYTNVNTQETKALAPVYVTIPVGTSTNIVTLTFPTMPAGADGFNIYRKKPGGFRYDYLASSSAVSYTDEGSVEEDCNRTVPTQNTTNGTNSVEIALASGVVPVGSTWRLYRTYTVGNYDNALLHWVVEETAEGSGIISPDYTDTGQGTSTGSPPMLSEAAGSPAKVQLTDVAEVQGRLPMGAVSAFPLQAMFHHPGAFTAPITLDDLWVCDVPKATVVSVRVILGGAPSTTDVIVDVNKLSESVNPVATTIFTTQANRPKVLVGQRRGSLAVPDVTAFVQGEGLSVDVDQDGGGASPTHVDLTVQVLLYVYGFGLTSHIWT